MAPKQRSGGVANPRAADTAASSGGGSVHTRPPSSQTAPVRATFYGTTQRPPSSCQVLKSQREEDPLSK